jgi:ribosomal protein S18 acetylase RimI-like enzyme
MQPDDLEALSILFEQQFKSCVYTTPPTVAALARQIDQPAAVGYYPVRWQGHLRLCAWRAGVLVGFLNAALGLDHEHLDQPEHHPFGLCRCLAVAQGAEAGGDVMMRLLEAGEQFWRQRQVERIIAFSLSTGYPGIQAGVGILPGDWAEHVRVFTGSGYHFTHRYYLQRRALSDLVEEEVPQAGLSLARQHSMQQSLYQVYHRRVEAVARARWGVATPPSTQESERTAILLDLSVSEPWRHRNIGKWLLRRMINDVTLAGFGEMIVFTPSNAAIAINLLTQQGFIEQNYRGYTLEKAC